MSDAVCRKCGGVVKFANCSLCEDCVIDPDVSPSIDSIAPFSFIRAAVDRKFDAIDHLRPEQFDSRETIAEQE